MKGIIIFVGIIAHLSHFCEGKDVFWNGNNFLTANNGFIDEGYSQTPVFVKAHDERVVKKEVIPAPISVKSKSQKTILAKSAIKKIGEDDVVQMTQNILKGLDQKYSLSTKENPKEVQEVIEAWRAIKELSKTKSNPTEDPEVITATEHIKSLVKSPIIKLKGKDETIQSLMKITRKKLAETQLIIKKLAELKEKLWSLEHSSSLFTDNYWISIGFPHYHTHYQRFKYVYTVLSPGYYSMTTSYLPTFVTYTVSGVNNVDEKGPAEPVKENLEKEKEKDSDSKELEGDKIIANELEIKQEQQNQNTENQELEKPEHLSGVDSNIDFQKQFNEMEELEDKLKVEVIKKDVLLKRSEEEEEKDINSQQKESNEKQNVYKDLTSISKSEESIFKNKNENDFSISKSFEELTADSQLQNDGSQTKGVEEISDDQELKGLLIQLDQLQVELTQAQQSNDTGRITDLEEQIQAIQTKIKETKAKLGILRNKINHLHSLRKVKLARAKLIKNVKKSS